MYPPLPAVLPTRLTAYLPGRLQLVPAEAWPDALGGPFARVGVRTTIPRYALDLRTGVDEVDPARVRWLAQGSTIRTLATRHVHLTAYQGLLWIVDGHTALAAHLAAGSDEVPVRLITRVDDRDEGTDAITSGDDTRHRDAVGTTVGAAATSGSDRTASTPLDVRA